MMRFFAVLALAGSLSSVFAAGELSGRRAPGFALPDLNLNYHDLYDHRGKVVIVDIMRTACPHCLTVSKNLNRLHAKYGSKVAVISIVNPPDNQTSVASYLRDYSLNTPIVFDCGQVSAAYLKITPKNTSINIPHVFIIDQQGMIRNDFSYSEVSKPILEGDGIFAEIDKLLGPAAKAPAAAKPKK